MFMGSGYHHLLWNVKVGGGDISIPPPPPLVSNLHPLLNLNDIAAVSPCSLIPLPQNCPLPGNKSERKGKVLFKTPNISEIYHAMPSRLPWVNTLDMLAS